MAAPPSGGTLPIVDLSRQVAGCRALIDAEPAFTQMRMELAPQDEPSPSCDRCYTVGLNRGTSRFDTSVVLARLLGELGVEVPAGR